jgi:hypothetical protein
MGPDVETILLDYAEAATAKLLGNLSAATMAGDVLWTASDEGRTVEALAPHQDGYRLVRQVSLQDLFPDLPKDEADLESLDANARKLWICGSHCRSRRKAPDGTKTSEIEDRPARNLFGHARLTDGGLSLKPPGKHAPLQGGGSLRQALGRALAASALALPTKEGGLDIEGLSVSAGTAWFGLRGPVIEGLALIVEQRIGRDDRLVGAPHVHRLDLGGLGVRELVRDGERLLVLAGPLNEADGPFRIFRWRPGAEPAPMHDFPAGTERPEGLCLLPRGGRRGLLVLYDKPADGRINGSVYKADWLALA